MNPFRFERVAGGCLQLLALGPVFACADGGMSPPGASAARENLASESAASELGAAAQALRCSEGEQLFERETFGGNGRTCATCHSAKTGTISPEDARRRFYEDEDDPLFLHDGSDDGKGNGVERMLADATILVEIPLPPNVHLANDPSARSVTVRRGVEDQVVGHVADARAQPCEHVAHRPTHGGDVGRRGVGDVHLVRPRQHEHLERGARPERADDHHPLVGVDDVPARRDRDRIPAEFDA